MARKRYYADPDAGREAGDTKTLAFAKALNRAILAKGWNQSDLARAAQPHMPKGKAFGRHLVSSYVRGASMPMPTQLDALSKALGVKLTDLVPEGDAEIIGSPTTVKLSMQSNGRTRVRLDMELDTETALQIAALVNKSTPAGG